MLATICYQPRVLLAVFIGTKIGNLSDGRQRSEMDRSKRLYSHMTFISDSLEATIILDGVSIAAGILLGLGVGW
jgi:uncharacterized membrane protein YbjE (DUF340 family)